MIHSYNRVNGLHASENLFLLKTYETSGNVDGMVRSYPFTLFITDSSFAA